MAMRLVARPLYAVGADVAANSITGKEPYLGSFHSPPVAQDLQQLRGKHNITIHPPFALFDPDDHALTIDISDLEADSLGNTQSGSVAEGQNRAMLDIPHTSQELQDFFGAQDNRQLLGRLCCWNNVIQAPILTKGDFVEKTKRRYGDADRAWSKLSLVC